MQEVQAELCHFLLRSARRSAKRQERTNGMFRGVPQPPCMATSAAFERLGDLLFRLSEVKHIAFLMENFLLSRYWMGFIPHESLLTEMLLTKRGGNRSQRSEWTVVQQQQTQQPQPPTTQEMHFSDQMQLSLFQLKRDPEHHYNWPSYCSQPQHQQAVNPYFQHQQSQQEYCEPHAFSCSIMESKGGGNQQQQSDSFFQAGGCQSSRSVMFRPSRSSPTPTAAIAANTPVI